MSQNQKSFDEIKRRVEIFKSFIPTMSYKIDEEYNLKGRGLDSRPLQIEGVSSHEFLIKYYDVEVGSAYNSADSLGLFNQKRVSANCVKKYVFGVEGSDPFNCRTKWVTLMPNTIEKHTLNGGIINSMCVDSSIQIDIENKDGSKCLVITPFNPSKKHSEILDIKTRDLSDMTVLKGFKGAIEDTHYKTNKLNEVDLPKMRSRGF
jgi:hypothetical protein